MTIEYNTNASGRETVTMTACPFCEYEFGPKARHDVHFLTCKHAPREIDYSYLTRPTEEGAQ